VKQEPSTEEQLRAKLQRAIKAAQSADDQLRQQGLLMGGSSRKEDLYRGELLHMRPLNWTLQKTRIFVKAREVYKIQTPSFLDVRFSSLSMPRFVI